MIDWFLSTQKKDKKGQIAIIDPASWFRLKLLINLGNQFLFFNLKGKKKRITVAILFERNRNSTYPLRAVQEEFRRLEQ